MADDMALYDPPSDCDYSKSELVVDDDHSNFQRSQLGRGLRRTNSFGEVSAAHVARTLARQAENSFEGGRRRSLENFHDMDEGDLPVEESDSAVVMEPAVNGTTENEALMYDDEHAASTAGVNPVYSECDDTQVQGGVPSYTPQQGYGQGFYGYNHSQSQTWNVPANYGSYPYVGERVNQPFPYQPAEYPSQSFQGHLRHNTNYGPYDGAQGHQPSVPQLTQYTDQSVPAHLGIDMNRGYQNTDALPTSQVPHPDDNVEQLTSEESGKVQERDEQSYKESDIIPTKGPHRRRRDPTRNNHTRKSYATKRRNEAMDEKIAAIVRANQ
ncbi:hypothetical protein I302_100697 [Kwoniella bestiolae CBS 10118]|uniref:Uncharacterized protein n=1 Tax=Kwoniella bestiolae CBS 10118 TaxID=1296100 RepID=A0A1B9G5T1_9TREE|nr:hypothetical protein I302_04072 [Kwoniella bestiolae CBS 10118]OCF26389.1 hypothetical protein I302_04072 [Kwoniella bestiolae CBS 10118]